MFCDGFYPFCSSVVDLNRSMFEVDVDEQENVQNTIDHDGIVEDSWCELCPEQESERLECLEELTESVEAAEDDEENIPDLAVTSEDVSHSEKTSNLMFRTDGLALERSLNQTQLNVFYQIR